MTSTEDFQSQQTVCQNAKEESRCESTSDDCAIADAIAHAQRAGAWLMDSEDPFYFEAVSYAELRDLEKMESANGNQSEQASEFVPGVVGIRRSSDRDNKKPFTLVMRRCGHTNAIVKTEKVSFDKDTRTFLVNANRKKHPPNGLLVASTSIMSLMEQYAAEYKKTFVIRHGVARVEREKEEKRQEIERLLHTIAKIKQDARCWKVDVTSAFHDDVIITAHKTLDEPIAEFCGCYGNWYFITTEHSSFGYCRFPLSDQGIVLEEVEKIKKENKLSW